MMVLVRALGYRRKRAAPGPFLTPCGRDDAHAVHALYSSHDVNATGNRPPSRAGLIHERKSLQPSRVAKRRCITAELAAVQLKPEYAEPFAQPQHADELGIPGRAVSVPDECLPQAPE